MGHFSALKTKGSSDTRDNGCTLETKTPREMARSQRDKRCPSPPGEVPGRVKFTETDGGRAGTSQGGQGVNGELVFSGDRASVLQDEKALEVVAAQRCEWTLPNFTPKIVRGLPWWPSG